MVAGGRTGRSAMLLDAGTSSLLADAAILLTPDTAAAVTSTVAAADAAAPVPGPRGLQQRFTQRRAEINTVSVPDLNLLSNLLCAS